ncbi:MAG: UDP-N-acetylmuramoyl-L-alanyl-D-glutamate--2,6-diaminopimelate ligase [Gemmatimonadales bacterium]
MIPIADVLARLDAAGLLHGPGPTVDLAVRGISADSRQVGPGDLYCAIRGYVHDGHDFLKEAKAAGAVAALVENPRAELDLLQIHVSDGRRAAALAAQVVFGEPATRLRLVGVTGTNGKTTTVHLIRHLLARRFASGSIGTLGVVTASGVRESTTLTTPGPVEFASRLVELEQDKVECVVAEVSSHALSQGRVDGVNFEVAAFTNLSRDHLDYHSDFDQYRAAKAHLADLVHPDGTLVVNADEPAWSDLPRRRVVRFGTASDAEYTARDIQLGRAGSRWTLVVPEAEVEVELPLLGEFNISNALAAAAVAGVFGLEAEVVGAALSDVPPVPGRLEVLADQPLVLRDYAHTPDALRRALAALRPLTRMRLIVVFGCGGDRDPGKRPLMGRAAAAGADHSIVTSDNPRSEEPEAIIADILPGLGSADHEAVVDRRAAIARALQIAGPDDTILLAGKGHEEYQIVGDEVRPLDEAAIVAEQLADGRELS